ncbi:pyrroline-5-carboxylate reductase [Gluconobacter cerinus]|uniref:pyrroline-5-carboxylate reductase n=1 Tax=Gluconobacter cerinus TaxID=38307 RepID=UPI001B8BF7BA|nr:pyrroline-5-carboxylate reductase [Gluconobacter cerinus]MBS1033502.1 pyrroline-5-carboxylate reductase [Gluconobacter cerinus]MBS1040460.1 pyrroline-5-carboxylate reductase [Gluconobacter cerinus]MBS1047049.1 pyrroline-5-carboxylate reductase [Gluconobacter cerinus]
MTLPSTPSILLVGCGKLGGALLDGWLASPTPPHIIVVDRHRSSSDDTFSVVRAASDIPSTFTPDIIVLAVKPATAEDAISALGESLGSRMKKAALLSVMAGRTCAALSDATSNSGATLPILRAMPNTPSAIGAGISGFYASPQATEEQTSLCHELLFAVGDVVRVDSEEDLLAVTAVSGSGPAYVFLLAELLEKAGEAHGLSQTTARRLARGTIYGAGRMLDDMPDDAADLRKAVTSPNGTTAAALNVLMAPDAWPSNISKAIDAATKRADELAG